MVPLQGANGTWRFVFNRVCRFLRNRPLLVKAPSSLLFHLQHLLFFLELSGRASALCVWSAYLDATTSVVSAGSLRQLLKPSLLVLIQSRRDLVSFFPVCLLPPPEALFRHFETNTDTLVRTCDVWSRRLQAGPAWNSAHPSQIFLEVCQLWKEKISQGFSVALKQCHRCLWEFMSPVCAMCVGWWWMVNGCATWKRICWCFYNKSKKKKKRMCYPYYSLSTIDIFHCE